MPSVPLWLALTGVAVALGLAAYAVFATFQDKRTVRQSLRRLEGYDVDTARASELLDPLSERAFAPVLATLTNLGRRFTPSGYVDQVRSKLTSLGQFKSEALDRFLAVRVVTVVLVPVTVVLLFALSPVTGKLRVGLVLLLGMGLILGPDAMLNRKVEDRQKEVRDALPDVLDLLVISVEAGLGFEQALDRTINSVPSALSDEFTRMLGEVRAGANRADAMRAMDARCGVAELRSFVLAIIQADQFGVSIGRILRQQADEMRIKRRQLAQEKAMKAPVKMLIPMVFCIFPAIFVITLGPAVINITRNF